MNSSLLITLIKKRLTPALSVLVALLLAGLPALRRADFSSKVSAQQGNVPLPIPPPAGILYVVDSTGDGDNVGPSTICDDGTGHCTLQAVRAGRPGAPRFSAMVTYTNAECPQ